MRKKIIRVAVYSFVLLFAAHCVLAAGCALYGRQLLVPYLTKALHVPVSMRAASFSFPFRLTFQEFSVGTVATAKKLSVSFYPAGLIVGRVVLSNVQALDPVIRMERDAAGAINVLDIWRHADLPALYVLGVQVRNGTANFTDHMVSAAGVRVALRNVNMDIGSRFPWPFARRVAIVFKGEGVNAQGGAAGTVSGKGWVDVREKNGEGVLEAKKISLAPWSASMGGLFPGNTLVAGDGDFTARIKGTAQQAIASCTLQLSGMQYENSEPNKSDAVFKFFSGMLTQARMSFDVIYLFDTRSLRTSNVKVVLGTP